ncbi:MAG: PEGA domain-containing protein [Deltaproteobacteria bacterium]|nr:PEGA domain-containing protein [Deltaproteobacteria bacterium]
MRGKSAYGFMAFVGVAAVISGLLAGCGGPLQATYKSAGPGAAGFKGQAATIILNPYVDSRKEKDPRRIGDISVTVGDMTGTDLVLDRDVSTFVTNAFKEELASAGFNVTSDTTGSQANQQAGLAGYVMAGEIRELRYDIGSRDKIAIEIFTSLKDASGGVVWSGVEKEEAEQYAGVMGNSRRTINNHLSDSLSKVIRKTIAEATAAMAPGAARQELPAPYPPRAAAVSGAFGVGAEVRPMANQPSSTAGTPAMPPAAKEKEAASIGRLLVTTEPPRAKVYVGDVYYGLSPMTIDLGPGIYDVRLMLRGYKEEKEKVAVRAGYTTELETIFMKE